MNELQKKLEKHNKIVRGLKNIDYSITKTINLKIDDTELIIEDFGSWHIKKYETDVIRILSKKISDLLIQLDQDLQIKFSKITIKVDDLDIYKRKLSGL